MCSRKQCFANNDTSTIYDCEDIHSKNSSYEFGQINKKDYVDHLNKDDQNVIYKCKTCCKNEARPRNGVSRKSSDGALCSLSTNECVRKVGRRVCEILDLLARSDNDMECADACWLMDLLKSVIRALDDLQSGCCDLRQKTDVRQLDRLSGASGGSVPPSLRDVTPCENLQNVCSQCSRRPIDVDREELIKAAAKFGCVYGYTVCSDVKIRR